MSNISQSVENTPAELIKAKRKRLNMTQKELADAIGMSKFGDRTIRRWENGDTEPSALELRAILNFPEQVPFKNDPSADYKIIDLFAGIGGTRLGFWQTGRTQSVFSSEIDKFAVKTYQANFGDIPFGDITKIDTHDIPDHDILVAGFPCQAFSIAGTGGAGRSGFDDNFKGQNRGNLFLDVVRICEYHKPKVIFCENVKGLAMHDRGRTFQVIRQAFRDIGY